MSERVDNNSSTSINFNSWLRNRQSEAHRAPGQRVELVSCSELLAVPPKTKYRSISFDLFEDSDSYQYTPMLAAGKFSERQILRGVRGSFEEFSSDMLSMLNDSSSSDVTIKCGSEVLKAHKNILSARSPVFKTMFSTSMRESSEGTVSIEDIDSAVVRDMLTFIYSNQVQDLSVPKACDLLNAAEMYQMQGLKRICVDFLKSSLSMENAFLILQKADLYDKNLKSYTIKFISEKFSDLKKTKEWKIVESNNPFLALEVLNAIVEKFI